MDASRLHQLRRRIERDPASFVFAQLAEELRRAGAHREAIQTCRAGLLQRPGYHSARVILGRCLLETGNLPAAEIEFRKVVESAPDNLSAMRGLTEVRERMAQMSQPGGTDDRSDALAALEMFHRTIVLYRQRHLGHGFDASR